MRPIAGAVLIITGAFFISRPVSHGALKVTTPSQVCGFLAELGLRAGMWKSQWSENEFGCLCPYRELGAGNPLANI